MKNYLRLIVFVFVLVGLISGGSRAAKVGAGQPEPLSLAVIHYDHWENVEQIRSLALHVLDFRENVLLAILSAEERTNLEKLGFNLDILDTPATPDRYYLAFPLPAREAGWPSVRVRVFPYTPNASVLAAEPEDIEHIASQGSEIKKLFGSIDLPAAPPAEISPGAAILAYNPLIGSLTGSVSQTAIHDAIRYLQDDAGVAGWDALGSRHISSPELAGKRDYIRNQMQALGLDTRYQNFSYSSYPLLQNIEGVLPGWGPGDETIYIACAHYDSISPYPYDPAPGADDNASGVAGVLEAARILSPYRFEHTLRFVAFSAEEQGLIGSYHYVTEAANLGTDIGGTINLDMIGWDSNGDNHLDVHVGSRSNSQALGTVFINAMNTYAAYMVPQYITSGASTFSDHSRFWDRSYAAIMLIEDYYPNRADFNAYYHTTNDKLVYVDLPYAAGFVQATVASLAELAQIIPPGLRLAHFSQGRVMTGTAQTLTVSYDNPGPDPVTGVVMTDTLSQGLTYLDDGSGFPYTQPAPSVIVWQVGALAPYVRSSFVVTVEVASGLEVGSVVTSTVEGAGIAVWDDPADNTAVWEGHILPPLLNLPLILKNSP